MNQKEQDRVDTIVSLKNAAADSRNGLESKIEKWYQLYNQVLPTDTVYPWRSKVFVPELQKVFDTIHPIFMDMLFGQEIPFKTKGVSGDIDKSKSDTLNALIKVYIDKMEMYENLDDFVKEEMIIGTAFGKLTWKKEVREYEEEVTEEIPQTVNMFGQDLPTGEVKTETKNVTKQKIIKDSPEFEWVSWKDIFFSSKARSLKDTWIIHRSYKTLDELEKVNQTAKDRGLEPIYSHLKELEDFVSTAQRVDNGEQINNDIKLEMGLTTEELDKAKHLKDTLSLNEYGEIEILEYWSWDGATVETVAGNLVLIRQTDNPYKHHLKPFLHSNYVRRPGEIWGKGICELCEDSVDHLNTVVNQAIDSNSLIDNLMLLVSRDAGIDLNDVKARPGGVIPVDVEPNQRLQDVVQQLVFQKIDTTVEQAIAREDIRDVTGASRFMQGNFESGAVRSGTQQRQIMNAGGKKFAGKILTFESMFLKPFIRQMYALIGQFMTEDIAVRILDDQQKAQSVIMTYEDIIQDVDFIPMGSRQLVEQEIIVHQLSTLLSITNGIPNGQLIINAAVLVRKVAENLGMSQEDIGQIVLNEQQSKQALMQTMAMNGGMEASSAPPTAPGQPNTGGGLNIG
jgi:hypothetical protein